MKTILTFEGFESKENPESKERPEKKEKSLKRCIGKCNRQMFIKNGKPVIHCPSCERTFEI
jgi:hypothetical protein